jgi:hypothetical protein
VGVVESNPVVVVKKEISLRKKREAGCRAVNGEGPRKGRKKEIREIKSEVERHEGRKVGKKVGRDVGKTIGGV